MQRIKRFKFSQDWSTNPQTSEINKTVIYELGGLELIAQTIDKGKGQMQWSTTALLQKKSTMSSKEKKIAESNIMMVQDMWTSFLTCISPIVTENEHYHDLLSKFPDR